MFCEARYPNLLKEEAMEIDVSTYLVPALGLMAFASVVVITTCVYYVIWPKKERK